MRPTQPGPSQFGTLALVWLSLSLRLLGAPADPGLPALDVPGLPALPDLPKLSLWDTVFTLQSSAGYKDNVALSATRPSGSPLVRQQAEAIVTRLPLDGLEFYAFLSGEDTRFLASQVVDKEQNLLAFAQVKKAWNEHWSTSLAGQYIYQNQVVDLSSSFATPTVLAVESHTCAVRFAVRRAFAEHWWCELEPGLTRQDFNSPLDDYWEGGPKVSLGRGYGFRSEAMLSYEFNFRPYDHRAQFDRTAAAIPGSALAFTQHRGQLIWKHHWDEQRHWRTTAKLSYETSHDNGPGYFDFHRWQASQQVRWAVAPWEVRVTGRFGQYRFPRQLVAPGDPRPVERSDLSLNLHLERALGKHWKWFLEFDSDRSLPNQPGTGYAANLVHSGVSAEF